MGLRGVMAAILGFNPCRVFSGLATAFIDRTEYWRLQVSIPVGFFQALQPPDVHGI